MKGTAVHIISDIEAPKPNVGSAMAALLAQVPAPLAAQIRDAWHDDLTFMFTTGMDAGQKIVFDAFENAGVKPPEPAEKPTPARPELRLVLGGAL